jgi:hypothetical protein
MFQIWRSLYVIEFSYLLTTINILVHSFVPGIERSLNDHKLHWGKRKLNKQGQKFVWEHAPGHHESDRLRE